MAKKLDNSNNLTDHMISEENINKPVKNEAAVALGRLGGLKGGKARANSLTPERRKEIAKKAAEKRWGNVPPPIEI